MNQARAARSAIAGRKPPRRLGILASHPIQYQAPLFRALAERLDLEVFFAHRQTPEQQGTDGFGTAFDWDVDLLAGYRSRFLDNHARRPGVDRFLGTNTPEIAATVRQGRFDAVLVTGWHLRAYWQAIRACRRSGTPVLVRGDSHLLTPRSPIKRLVKAGLHRWLIRQFDGFLYVGERNRAYLERYGAPPDRLSFAPHAVDNDWFRARAHVAAAGRAGFRRALGIDPDERVVLFAGKLVPVKRPFDLVDALAHLKRAEVRLVVAGAGPLEAAIAARARTHGLPVTFAGFRNQSELPAFYDLADVLVLCSTSETWGLVVNEALACGTPAVVTDGVGCAPDLIEPGLTGAVVGTGDPQALAAGIEAMLGRKHEPAVQAALAAKVARYSIETAVDGIQAALERVGFAKVVASG